MACQGYLRAKEVLKVLLYQSSLWNMGIAFFYLTGQPFAVLNAFYLPFILQLQKRHDLVSVISYLLKPAKDTVVSYWTVSPDERMNFMNFITG